jgi:dGTPase
VFLNHEGDLFRTRMTHSLEVAQLGRSIARSLQLNEDLVEAIALAHDLGHTPFGHAGQDALNACMQAHGGFEHNLQSLRVVDRLEERYPEFDGLNLSFETREGILKHCALKDARALEAQEPDGVARRFLDRTQPSLEAQLCNLADEIAYNAHDIDDGVRSGLLRWDQLSAVPLFSGYHAKVWNQFPSIKPRRAVYEAIRRMLSDQVYDVIASTQAALAQVRPRDLAQVRAAPPLVSFSPAMREASTELKRYLFSHLYRHPRVAETMAQARQVISELFDVYVADPAAWTGGVGVGPEGVERAAADYIAGMTDRFALREHERISGRRVFGD